MLNFRGAQFIKSATKRSETPQKKLPEVVFIGKSNVGKSSLINGMCDNKSLCFTSSKPGHTRLLNYFEIHDVCYLVDAPGYGYSKAGGSHAMKFSQMMEEYFTSNEMLKSVLFLLDSRHGPSDDDLDFYNFLKNEHINHVLVLTKVDKLNQSEKAKMMKMLKTHFTDLSENDVMFTSASEKTGMDKLKSYIANVIN